MKKPQNKMKQKGETTTQELEKKNALDKLPYKYEKGPQMFSLMNQKWQSAKLSHIICCFFHHGDWFQGEISTESH